MCEGMNRRLFAALFLLVLFLSWNFVWLWNTAGFTFNGSMGDSRFDELIIGVRGISHLGHYRLMNLLKNYYGKVKDTVYLYGQIEAIVVRLPSVYLKAFTDAVKEAIEPDYIERNNIYKICFIPKDPYWSLEWGMKKIEVDFAWNISVGSSSILVAVIDTGIDWNHPDLVDNYVALGYDWVNDDPDPMDDNGHGTHVAGIIAAIINNGIGVAGLAQVKIMAEKALNANGYGTTDALANAIIHATNAGAKIIVMSWGDYADSILLYNAITYAYEKGVLLVAAAGNDATSEKMYPAAYNEVIAVSATDESDNLARFSNFGSWIELAAPGKNIFSTVWDDDYSYKSGTSMAAPFVAGVAALTWSVYPQLSRDDLRIYLHERADDLGDPGFDIYYGYGRINARKAVGNITGIQDIALYSVSPRKSVVGEGMRMRVDANITNLGSEEEGFNATLYVNGTRVESVQLFLQAGQSINFTFHWNTTGFSKGRYVVSCCISPLPCELNVENNVKNSSSIVWVAIVGDITSVSPAEPDGKVDIRDLALVAICYDSRVGDLNWNPNADINDDDKINFDDLLLAASNFGAIN